MEPRVFKSDEVLSERRSAAGRHQCAKGTGDVQLVEQRLKRSLRTFYFCPDCGAQAASADDIDWIPVGDRLAGKGE